MVIIGSGAAWLRSDRPGTPASAEAEDAPVVSKWFGGSSPQTFEPPERPVRVPKPIPHWLRVVDSEGRPVDGASVEVRASFDPDQHLWFCDDLEHLRSELAALEAKPAPELLGSGTTSDGGVAHFPPAAWPEVRVYSVRVPGQAERTFTGEVHHDLQLREPSEGLLNVGTPNGVPVRAEVTLIDAVTGAITTMRTDEEGHCDVPKGRALRAIARADGHFPAFAMIDGMAPEYFLRMDAMGSVAAIAPSDLADVEISLNSRAATGHTRKTRLEHGRATFQTMRPGMITIDVTEPGYIGGGSGELYEGEHLEIALAPRRAGSLALTVVNVNGQPIDAVTASCSAAGREVSDVGRDGSRLVLGPIAVGPGVLSVSAPGFRDRSQSLTIVPGETELEVVLDPAPLYRGRVVMPDGSPAAGALVQVTASSTLTDVMQSVAEEDGTFEVFVAEEGTWTMTAVLEGSSAYGRATVTVPGPMVTLTIRPEVVLSVRVLDHAGKPVQGASLLLAGTERTQPLYATSDEAGEAAFEELDPGPYQLEVHTPDPLALHRSERIVVTAAAEQEHVVRFEAPVTFHGKLVDEKGAALADVLILDTPNGVSATTDERGEFTFEGLPPKARVEFTLTFDAYSGTRPESVIVGNERVVVTALTAPDVKGRVVDAQGKPVPEFRVNDFDFNALDDGRFSIQVAPTGTLRIERPDGVVTVVEVKNRTDVGDIVVPLRRKLRGRVIDEQRRPLPSVALESKAFLEGVVMTRGDGTFEAPVDTTDFVIHLEARFEDLSVVSDVTVSDEPLQLVLTGPTLVEGLVYGADGRPGPTTVIAMLIDGEERRVDADAKGAFSLRIVAGTWRFSTHGTVAATTVRISGQKQFVEVGTPSACSLKVTSLPPPSGVTYLPSGVADSATPGALTLGFDGQAFSSRGVPCGSGQVIARYGGSQVVKQVTMSRGVTSVEVEAPPLRNIEDLSFE